MAYPAAYDEVIAVGSVTAAGTPAANSANGEALELMAPGENILSSGIFGGTMGASGTSMAAPHVVGAASVLMELNPEMSADYIRALLNYSANLYGDSDEYGNGVIDLEYAIEINDKFKKLYEKHMKKASKNKKEKEQQKDKFWGEVLKTIPENEKAVETFAEVEVVEGMWNATNHKLLLDYSDRETSFSFTAEQMKILMYACTYPDVQWSGLADMDDNPYHGFLWSRSYDIVIEDGSKKRVNYRPKDDSNYIANYVFLTEIARIYGNSSMEELDKNLNKFFEKKASYMLQNDFDRMKEDFSAEMLGIQTWEDVFNGIGTNVDVTPENMQLFVYGIAIHSVSDIFAHSTWAKHENSTAYTRIKHDKGADEPHKYTYRYMAVQLVLRNVLQKAYAGEKGLVKDFIIPTSYFGTKASNRYCLGNFAPYAKAVDSDVYRNNQTFFSYTDLKSGSNGKYDFEKDIYFVP